MQTNLLTGIEESLNQLTSLLLSDLGERLEGRRGKETDGNLF